MKTDCGMVAVNGVTGAFEATTAFDPAPFQNAAKITLIDGIDARDWCSPRLRKMIELPNRVEESNPYGDIVLDSAPNGGSLRTGRTGSITVRASGGHLGASTNRGNIELSNVRGDATARSSVGNITIRLVNTDGAEHHVNARTFNGSVTIELPDEIDATIDAEIITTDSSAAKGAFSRIIDRYDFNRATPGIPDASRVLVAKSGASRISKGRGSGRIFIRVTDGDIIFTRRIR